MLGVLIERHIERGGLGIRGLKRESVVKESILWIGFKRPSTYWG